MRGKRLGLLSPWQRKGPTVNFASEPGRLVSPTATWFTGKWSLYIRSPESSLLEAMEKKWPLCSGVMGGVKTQRHHRYQKQPQFINPFKSRFFGIYFEILNQCSGPPLLLVTSSDCEIGIRMFSWGHSNHTFVTSRLKGLKWPPPFPPKINVTVC